MIFNTYKSVNREIRITDTMIEGRVKKSPNAAISGVVMLSGSHPFS